MGGREAFFSCAPDLWWQQNSNALLMQVNLGKVMQVNLGKEILAISLPTVCMVFSNLLDFGIDAKGCIVLEFE